MGHHRKLTLKSLRSTTAGPVRAGALLLLAAFCGCVTAAAQTSENVELLSVNGSGDQAGNGRSTLPRSSANGRFVVFESAASDLVPNDANGATSDVFVRDQQQKTTTLVSINAAGTASGNGASSGASITPDGRYVVFVSDASDLAPNDTNGKRDVFVRDLQQKTTRLVSVNAAGTASGGGDSLDGLITPDGRYVVFTSRADDLTAGVSNQAVADVFRRDLVTGTTVLVSVNAANTNGGNGNSSATAVTPDGRYVLFGSNATDLSGTDANGTANDFFRRDMQTNATALVTVNRAGSGTGDGKSLTAVMSDDGQVVVFASQAKDLVADDNNGTGTSVYARDFTANATTLISEKQAIDSFFLPTVGPASEPRISADGRYVIYKKSEAQGDWLSRPGPNSDKILRRDRLTGELFQLPNLFIGTCRTFVGCLSIISGVSASTDGHYVAYTQTEFPRGTGPPPITAALLLRDLTGGGGYELISGFFGTNTTGPPGALTLRAGNIVPGPMLPFSSGVSHSSKDTNAVEDAYFFAAPHFSRIGFIMGFIPAAYSGSEGGGTATVEVRRLGLFIDSTESVHYSTSDGTAAAGSDYTAVSGTLTFGPGETSKTFSVPITDDNISERAEYFNLTLDSPTGGAALGDRSTTTVTIFDNDPNAVQFTSARFDGSEAAGAATVTVELLGAATLQTIRVDYATSDGTASERGDYITALGRIEFARGERSKTFKVLVNDDAFVEGDETVNLTLSNPTGGAVLGPNSTAQLHIASDDTAPTAANPLDQSQFFVAQHYRDFLSREPDAAGFAFWTDQIESCGADAQCREVKRINVSAAFFLSIEFQQTGYLVYRAYGAAFGTRRVGGTVPLTLREFIGDTQFIGAGVIVNEGNWQARLETNKQTYFEEFASRPSFVARYPASMSAAEYVDALNANAGGALTQAERDNLVSRLAAGQNSRGQVLRAVAENAAFSAAERNRAFVLMQYFGYLRRNPDAAPDTSFSGYDFWLRKLNQFNGNFVQAEMVKAFISSTEYRQRFGQ